MFHNVPLISNARKKKKKLPRHHNVMAHYIVDRSYSYSWCTHSFCNFPTAYWNVELPRENRDGRWTTKWNRIDRTKNKTHSTNSDKQTNKTIVFFLYFLFFFLFLPLLSMLMLMVQVYYRVNKKKKERKNVAIFAVRQCDCCCLCRILYYCYLPFVGRPCINWYHLEVEYIGECSSNSSLLLHLIFCGANFSSFRSHFYIESHASRSTYVSVYSWCVSLCICSLSKRELLISDFGE